MWPRSARDVSVIASRLRGADPVEMRGRPNLVSSMHLLRRSSKAAHEGSAGVGQTLSEIAPDVSPEELPSRIRAVGKVMGDILFEITEPILKSHPELLPDTWRDADAR